MLFDLRGRGRRRAVQVIYVGLALLIGGGLVLFGVGAGTGGGGLLDAFKNNSGSTSTDKVFKKRLDAAEKGVQLHPTDPRAWATLTSVQYQRAASGSGIDQNTGTFTDKGKQDLQQASNTYQKYLTLTRNPSPNLAVQMVQAYGEVGLNDPDKTIAAFEIYLGAQRKPTDALYAQYASYAYAAGDTRKAELASKKAIALAPKEDKEQIKAQLQAARAQASVSASSSTPATTATTG
jgi:tetratricopeptide (TPR) repeat protein